MRIVSYILFVVMQEDCCLGDSISDGSEELLKVRGSRYRCGLEKEDTCNQAHILSGYC